MNATKLDTNRMGPGRALIGAVVMAGALLAMAGGAAAAPAASTNTQPAAESAGRVDVNSATAAELASLPGIGASKAAAIIAEREKKPFGSVEDLERVRGIGARTVEDLRGKISVGTR